jgi:hypothetical protein
MGGKLSVYELSAWKSEGKKSMRKSRPGSKNSSKIDLKYIRWEIWTEFIWFRTHTSGGPSWTWRWTIRLQIILGDLLIFISGAGWYKIHWFLGRKWPIAPVRIEMKQMEHLVKCEFVQCHIAHQTYNMSWLRTEHGPPRWRLIARAL